ncbi:Flp family type IVb pilin [Mesorhizobium sp. A623]
MTRLLCRFINDQTGATAIEYSLIATLISLAIFAGVGGLADSLQWLWSDNSSRLVQGFAAN